jgi:hypothetical protein
MSTNSRAVQFGIDYRDPHGALAHIRPQTYNRFKTGNLLLANTSAVQPDRTKLL